MDTILIPRATKERPSPSDPKGKSPLRPPSSSTTSSRFSTVCGDHDRNAASHRSDASDGDNEIIADILLSNCPAIRGLVEANRYLSLYKLREACERYTQLLGDVAPAHPIAFLNRSLCHLLLGYPELAVLDAYRALVCVNILKSLPPGHPQSTRVLLDLRMYTDHVPASLEPWMVKPTCYVGDGQLEFLNVDLASIHVEGKPRAKRRRSGASKDHKSGVCMLYEITMKAHYRMALGLWKLGGGAWQSARDQLTTASEQDFCTADDRKELDRLECKIYGEFEASLIREGEVMKKLKDFGDWTGEQLEAYKASGIDYVLRCRRTKVKRAMYPWNVDMASGLESTENTGLGWALRARFQRGSKGKCKLRVSDEGHKNPRYVVVAAKPHEEKEVIIGEKTTVHAVASARNSVPLQCYHCGCALAISPEVQKNALLYNQHYTDAVARMGLYGKENEPSNGRGLIDDEPLGDLNQQASKRKQASMAGPKSAPVIPTSPPDVVMREESDIERSKGKNSRSSATPEPKVSEFATPGAPASSYPRLKSDVPSTPHSGGSPHQLRTQQRSAARGSGRRGQALEPQGVSEGSKMASTLETITPERLEQFIFDPTQDGLPERPSGFQICPCCRIAHFCSRECYMTAMQGHHKTMCKFRSIEHAYDIEVPNDWDIPNPVATKLLDQMTQNAIVAATNDLELASQHKDLRPEDKNVVGMSYLKLVTGDLAPARPLPDDDDETTISLWDDTKSISIEELYPNRPTLKSIMGTNDQRKDTHHDMDTATQLPQIDESTIDWSFCSNVLLPTQTIFHMHLRQGNVTALMAMVDIKRFDGWMLETVRMRTAATMRISKFPRCAKMYDNEGNVTALRGFSQPVQAMYPQIPEGGFVWTASLPFYASSLRSARNVMPCEEMEEGQKKPNVQVVDHEGVFYIRALRPIEEGEELVY